MMDDKDAVPGSMHVEFDEIHVQHHRIAEGGEAVFRPQAGAGAMGCDESSIFKPMRHGLFS
jgi:hypothetical protein